MKNVIGIWAVRHLQVLFDTLGRLWQAPFASGMTILVLAIALALPLFLFKVVDRLQDMAEGWQGHSEISLFLHMETDGSKVDALSVGQRLLRNPVIEDVRHISPEEGIQELSRTPGLSAAVESLPENPLPPVLVVLPVPDLTVTETEELAGELDALDEVDVAVFDQRWLHRLAGIVELIRRIVIALAVLMGVGVLMVISNTVRLGISNRAAEIEIIDQVGGTRAFIRRPFLYAGAIQCFLGSVLAWLVADLVLFLLSQPIQRLAALYHSEFQLGWVGIQTGFAMIAISVLLGLLASRLTVDHYIRDLGPG